MRLEKIKLAGFKSFVDPTTIAFSSNLMGIVGPNGCGKSNVIDAVRWVMGESSAKYLRGEAIEDVIFNGSSGRKPLAKAAIEMTFDNSSGKLGGQYSNYSQISVRREVERGGQSNYYLNGGRCRRRDIMDVFLGTGLSPRSYAIIEQGMINRIIEAKAQDLRSNFEEVSGISKYKERRRETENRIKHTKENLCRIGDLVDALDKQVGRLKRQARAAQHYKTLKAQERNLKGQLLAARWQQLDKDIQQGDKLVTEGELLLESKQAHRQGIDTDAVKLRQQRHDSNERYTEAQQQIYQTSSEISRLEQTLSHHHSRHKEMTADLSQLEHSLAEAQQHTVNDQAQIDGFSAQLERLTPQRQQAQQLSQQSQQLLEEAEQQLQGWQTTWDAFNEQSAQTSRAVEIEQTRMTHLEQQQHHTVQRLAIVDSERQTIDHQQLERAHQGLIDETKNAEQKTHDFEQRLEQLRQQQQQQRQSGQQLQQELTQAQAQLQQHRGRLVSLETLQQAALGKQGKQQLWMEKWGLADQSRLAEQVTVESGWERAVEAVLGHYLEAVCVDNTVALTEMLTSFDKGSLSLLTSGTESLGSRSDSDTLASKVKSDLQAVHDLLDGVYLADNLAAALQLRPQLKKHQAVVTADGIVLGQCWLRVVKGEDTKAGVLQREVELRELRKHITTAKSVVQRKQQQLVESGVQVEQLEAQLAEAQQQLTACNSELASRRTDVAVHRDKMQQLKNRGESLSQEATALKQQAKETAQQLTTAEKNWKQASADMTGDREQRQELLGQRQQQQKYLTETRQQAQQNREKSHQLDLRFQTLQSQLQSASESLLRMKKQHYDLQQRQQRLEEELSVDAPTAKKIQQQLEQFLSKQLTQQDRLQQCKQQLSDVDHQFSEKEQTRATADQEIQEVRAALESERLKLQEYKVRRMTLQETLDEFEYELAALLSALPAEFNETTVESELHKIASRIARLGTINLAAIEELESELERKEYLDSQKSDLEEALHTLESAIRKIDQETRQRFRETFDKVNEEFKRLFPKIFGGGRAYLELTDDNLLETGVAVMAQPPGKKNSSIHLLSGGEKALTAIALVFSMFQLNPAPFCMLDEVDAPLDDANVLRYSRLVQEMSEQVQFIFITHNKVTMEMAEQLTGVTMNEPGVSRIVAVDVDKAVEMAAA